MGIEPTTRSLGIFWFIDQLPIFRAYWARGDSERNKNTTRLRGHCADKSHARFGRLPMFSAASF